MVGLPYVKCRLDLFYQKVSGNGSILGDNEQEELEDEELQNTETKASRKLMIRLIRLFKKVYPMINLLYYGSNLAYNVAYLFGKTRYYTPWLHLLGLQVQRMSMNDYVSFYLVWGLCIKLIFIYLFFSVLIMINQPVLYNLIHHFHL